MISCLSILLIFSLSKVISTDPCTSNTLINGQYRRSSNYTLQLSDVAISDNFLTSGWYRFDSGAGNDMVTSAPSLTQCGTIYPIWMLGTLPSDADGEVTRTACIAGLFGSCATRLSIKVKSCVGYRVYYLVPPPQTSTGYCIGEGSLCPAGQSSSTGFTPCQGTEYENETSTTTPASISTASTTTPASITTASTTTPASITTASTTTPASITTASTTTPASITTASTTTPASITTASTTTPASISTASTTTSKLTLLKSRSTGVQTNLVIVLTCLGVGLTLLLGVLVFKVLRVLYPKFGRKVVDKKSIDIGIDELNEMPPTPDNGHLDPPQIGSPQEPSHDHLEPPLSQSLRELLSDSNEPQPCIEIGKKRIKK
ncbi:spore coat protein SP96-like [Ostrea edulis]|uniref:spore coat protein SP96-like n=1 Tax=Ostrea edulis TaxID=37623 RepID=UPI0024B000BE|nr:spore coat protein SP96-like [Ostrea edulis]